MGGEMLKKGLRSSHWCAIGSRKKEDMKSEHISHKVSTVHSAVSNFHHITTHNTNTWEKTNLCIRNINRCDVA